MAAKKKVAKVAKGTRPAPTRRIAYDPNSEKAVFFCERFLIHGNQTLAAEEAGYSKKRAKQTGCDLMQLPVIQARILELIEARSKRTGIEADVVLRRFYAIATADPRELVEYRRGACRYCHGVSHQYQRTEAERERLFKEWEKIPAGEKRNAHQYSTVTGEFDELGGIGYLRTREPHPECPECEGLGHGEIVVKDQRNLSDSALQLLAGVKETKEGLEVKMHSQPDALTNLARHLGLFKDKVEHSADESLEALLAKSWGPQAAGAGAHA